MRLLYSVDCGKYVDDGPNTQVRYEVNYAAKEAIISDLIGKYVFIFENEVTAIVATSGMAQILSEYCEGHYHRIEGVRS